PADPGAGRHGDRGVRGVMSPLLLGRHRLPLLRVAVDEDHVLRHVVRPIVSGPGGPPTFTTSDPGRGSTVPDTTTAAPPSGWRRRSCCGGARDPTRVPPRFARASPSAPRCV